MSAPLPWSIITLFTKKLLIYAVTTNVSSCSWIVPFRSCSSKEIASQPTFILFLGGCFSMQVSLGTTANTPLLVIITPLEAAWMTLIIPNGGRGRVFSLFANHYNRHPNFQNPLQTLSNILPSLVAPNDLLIPITTRWCAFYLCGMCNTRFDSSEMGCPPSFSAI